MCGMLISNAEDLKWYNMCTKYLRKIGENFQIRSFDGMCVLECRGKNYCSLSWKNAFQTAGIVKEMAKGLTKEGLFDFLYDKEEKTLLASYTHSIPLN